MPGDEGAPGGEGDAGHHPGAQHLVAELQVRGHGHDGHHEQRDVRQRLHDAGTHHTSGELVNEHRRDGEP
jgi:hypothetical protein